jgi:hypothetical protein
MLDSVHPQNAEQEALRKLCNTIQLCIDQQAIPQALQQDPIRPMQASASRVARAVCHPVGLPVCDDSLVSCATVVCLLCSGAPVCLLVCMPSAVFSHAPEIKGDICTTSLATTAVDVAC